MQRCAECGCQTPWGESMTHFIGCEHTSSHGKGQAQALSDFLSGKVEQAGLNRTPKEPSRLPIQTDPKLAKHLLVNLH